MKPKAFVSALVAMSLALGGPVSVLAQGGNQRQQEENFNQVQRAQPQQAQRGQPPQAQRGQPQRAQPQQAQRGQYPQGQQGKQPPGQRGYQQQGSSSYAQRGDGRPDERGAGPDHNYHRGDRLPAEYRHHNYVVDDWRGHGLSAPPRGYQWVQSGTDYLLVAIATGIILQLLLNN